MTEYLWALRSLYTHTPRACTRSTTKKRLLCAQMTVKNKNNNNNNNRKMKARLANKQTKKTEEVKY